LYAFYCEVTRRNADKPGSKATFNELYFSATAMHEDTMKMLKELFDSPRQYAFTLAQFYEIHLFNGTRYGCGPHINKDSKFQVSTLPLSPPLSLTHIQTIATKWCVAGVCFEEHLPVQ
jgi:hypothetical protein